MILVYPQALVPGAVKGRAPSSPLPLVLESSCAQLVLVGPDFKVEGTVLLKGQPEEPDLGSSTPGPGPIIAGFPRRSLNLKIIKLPVT
jgi:hypothetical protein